MDIKKEERESIKRFLEVAKSPLENGKGITISNKIGKAIYARLERGFNKMSEARKERKTFGRKRLPASKVLPVSARRRPEGRPEE